MNDLKIPNVDRAYMGAAKAIVEGINSRQVIIVESGVIGGDLLPRSSMEATRKELEKALDNIAANSGDDVDVQFVGSTAYGAGGSVDKAFFGDIDVVLHMEKLETLSRIKQWAFQHGQNVRDINSRKGGDELDVEDMGSQFSFLFPIYKENGDKVTIGELRYAMQQRDGETTWKSNHDERLKLQSNLKNTEGRHGPAMVQIDVVRTVVDDQELETLQAQAASLADRLEQLSNPEDGKIDSLREYKDWLNQYLDKGEVEEFADHYEFLRKHGELQSVEDQRHLAALHMLQDKDAAKKAGQNRAKAAKLRYTFHPDALQMVHYIAGQMGMTLEDDNFTKDRLERLLERAERAGILREPKGEDNEGRKLAPAEIKRLSVDMLRDPASLNEAMSFFQGKHKDAVRRAILSGTRNKRANEQNPNALFRNYGSREIQKV